MPVEVEVDRPSMAVDNELIPVEVEVDSDVTLLLVVLRPVESEPTLVDSEIKPVESEPNPWTVS
jgi:pilus assembly protein FimV